MDQVQLELVNAQSAEARTCENQVLDFLAERIADRLLEEARVHVGAASTSKNHLEAAVAFDE